MQAAAGTVPGSGASRPQSDRGVGAASAHGYLPRKKQRAGEKMVSGGGENGVGGENGGGIDIDCDIDCDIDWDILIARSVLATSTGTF